MVYGGTEDGPQDRNITGELNAHCVGKRVFQYQYGLGVMSEVLVAWVRFPPRPPNDNEGFNMINISQDVKFNIGQEVYYKKRYKGYKTTIKKLLLER